MTLSKVNFSQRMSALQNKQKTRQRTLPFVREYHQSMPDLKHILMNKWHLIQNQPSLRKLFKNPPLHFIQKREVFERCTCQSETLRSLNFLSWPIGVVFGLSTTRNIVRFNSHSENYGLRALIKVYIIFFFKLFSFASN